MRKILLLLCILSITIGTKAQYKKSWPQGYYYDTVGVKHVGLISWEAPQKSVFAGKGDYLHFKANKNGEKIKLKQTDLKSFVIQNDSMLNDSFIVSKNILFTKTPFLQVLLNGKIKLFKLTRIFNTFGVNGGSSFIEDYYYGEDDAHLTAIDKKNFIDVMSDLLASKAYVVKRIKDKTFKLDKIEGLLYFYRTDNYPQSMLN
jgi:hypothetical protein